MLSRYADLIASCKQTHDLCTLLTLQKSHTGEVGKNGLCVARSVEVEFLTERENAFHQNVHTLILDTTNVMVVITKRKNVMKNAVHVSYNQPPELLTTVPIQNLHHGVHGANGTTAARLAEAV